MQTAGQDNLCSYHSALQQHPAIKSAMRARCSESVIALISARTTKRKNLGVSHHKCVTAEEQTVLPAPLEACGPRDWARREQAWRYESLFPIHHCHPVPASILRYSDRDVQPQRWDSFANHIHVNDGIDALRATFYAALRARAEAAVVQAFVADVMATLLQSDGGGHTRDTHVNHQLQENRNTSDKKARHKGWRITAHYSQLNAGGAVTWILVWVSHYQDNLSTNLWAQHWTILVFEPSWPNF